MRHHTVAVFVFCARQLYNTPNIMNTLGGVDILNALDICDTVRKGMHDCFIV